MNLFIDPNGNYPRFLGDIYLENPSWQVGDALPAGWIAVLETAIPELQEDEIFYEGPPTVIDGTVSQVWFTRSMTEEELYQRDAPKLIRQRMLDSGFTDEEINIVSRASF
jgi:hypothetical protein